MEREAQPESEAGNTSALQSIWGVVLTLWAIVVAGKVALASIF